jgi:hypothetical protein
VASRDYQSYGSATPMRGKSLTCRKSPPFQLRSMTAGRRPGEKEGFGDGKSETCRASAWQSQCKI